MGGQISRKGALLLAAAMLSTLTASAPASAASVPCRKAAVGQLRGNTMESVRLRTFHIEAEPQAESFPIGSKAKIDITVTRPAHEDPADQDIEFEPPTSTPAADVTVGVGIQVGNVFVPGFGRTDAEGKTTVSIKLPKYMKPGMASMTIYAWRVVHESPCLRVEEDGFRAYPEAFEVTR